MTTVPITLHVDPEAAKVFESASKEERNKIEAVLSLRLKELLHPTGITLRQAMDELGREAEDNGLTPEILESILPEDDDVEGPIRQRDSLNMTNTIPQYRSFYNPILKALKALGGSGSVKEINDKVIESLDLPDEALEKLHNPETGNQTEIEYRLAWARTYLKKYGLIDNSSRGVWALTKKAESVHEVNPDEVVKSVRGASRQNQPSRRRDSQEKRWRGSRRRRGRASNRGESNYTGS